MTRQQELSGTKKWRERESYCASREKEETTIKTMNNTMRFTNITICRHSFKMLREYFQTWTVYLDKLVIQMWGQKKAFQICKESGNFGTEKAQKGNQKDFAWRHPILLCRKSQEAQRHPRQRPLWEAKEFTAKLWRT